MEADVAEDGAEIAGEVVKTGLKVAVAVVAAVKHAVVALQRVNHVAANHEPLKKVELAQHQMYVSVLGVQKLAVTVVNVLARLVKAKKNQNLDQNQDQNQNPNPNQNQDQEQIKS